jgi:hypothetical protein
MKKIFIALGMVAVAILTIVACKKNYNATPNDAFTMDVAGKWWNEHVATTSMYKAVNPNSPNVMMFNEAAKKVNPNLATPKISKRVYWNNPKTYEIGGYKVVELPLVYYKNVIANGYISSLTADKAGQVAKATVNRMLFMKAANGTVEMRVVSIIPNYEYAAAKGWDISENTMQKLDPNFKGVIQIRKWDETIINTFNMEQGKIAQRTKFVPKSQANNPTANGTAGLVCVWETHEVQVTVCDDPPEQSGDYVNGSTNDVTVYPYCYFHHTELQNELVQVCVDEPNNPCDNLTGTDLDNCMCMNYNIGCPDGGGGGDDPCNGLETCESKAPKVKSDLENGTIGSSTNSAVIDGTTITSANGDKSNKQSKVTWTGVGLFSSFDLKARFNCVYTINGTQYPLLISTGYVWKSCAFDNFKKSGIPLGYDITATLDQAVMDWDYLPMQNRVDCKLDYELRIEYGCCGITAPEYKDIHDPITLHVKL